MYNDSWTDDTVPSARVDEAELGLTAIPAYVWILGFVVVALVLTVLGLWALYLLRGSIAIGGPTPTPIIWTPTPAPATATPAPTPTETIEPSPTPSPDIAIGRYVQVANTGGYGLSLRAGPGENYARMDVALEGEVFIVVEGPTLTSGSQWWKIRDYDNPQREWWAVASFLQPIEHP